MSNGGLWDPHRDHRLNYRVLSSVQGRSTLPALKCQDGVKQGCVLSPSLFPLAVDRNFSGWRGSRWLTSTLQVTYTDINAGEDWRDAQIRHPDLIWHTFKAKITMIPQGGRSHCLVITHWFLNTRSEAYRLVSWLAPCLGSSLI